MNGTINDDQYQIDLKHLSKKICDKFAKYSNPSLNSDYVHIECIEKIVFSEVSSTRELHKILEFLFPLELPEKSEEIKPTTEEYEIIGSQGKYMFNLKTCECSCPSFKFNGKCKHQIAHICLAPNNKKYLRVLQDKKYYDIHVNNGKISNIFYHFENQESKELLF